MKHREVLKLNINKLRRIESIIILRDLGLNMNTLRARTKTFNFRNVLNALISN